MLLQCMWKRMSVHVEQWGPLTDFNPQGGGGMCQFKAAMGAQSMAN